MAFDPYPIIGFIDPFSSSSEFHIVSFYLLVARFRTVIALIIDGKVTTFDGIVNGVITEGKRGGEGFGYDPIFMPEGYNKTFAELGTGIKNNISHRAKAVQKLADYLLKR